MSARCQVPGCGNKQNSAKSIFLHKFNHAHDGWTKRKWMSIFGLDKKDIENFLVCSKHFANNMFTIRSYREHAANRRQELFLKARAYPTLYIKPLTTKNEMNSTTINNNNAANHTVKPENNQQISINIQENVTKGTGSGGYVLCEWQKHSEDIKLGLPKVFAEQKYTDVTLVAESYHIKCHKIILAMSSSYFDNIFKSLENTQSVQPVIVLDNIKYVVLKCLLDFIYIGRFKCQQSLLPQIYEAAKRLKIPALVPNEENVCENNPENSSTNLDESEELPPQLEPMDNNEPNQKVEAKKPTNHRREHSENLKSSTQNVRNEPESEDSDSDNDGPPTLTHIGDPIYDTFVSEYKNKNGIKNNQSLLQAINSIEERILKLSDVNY